MVQVKNMSSERQTPKEQAVLVEIRWQDLLIGTWYDLGRCLLTLVSEQDGMFTMIDWLLIHALDRIKISTMKPFNQKSFKTAVLKTIEYQNGEIEEQLNNTRDWSRHLFRAHLISASWYSATGFSIFTSPQWRRKCHQLLLHLAPVAKDRIYLRYGEVHLDHKVISKSKIVYALVKCNDLWSNATNSPKHSLQQSI